MSTVAPERPIQEVDWVAWERQLDDGSGGFGGGNFDDDGGDHLPERPDDDGRIPPEAILGAGGLFIGMVAGIVGTSIADDMMVERYKQKNHIVTTPVTVPAVHSGIYNRAVNKNIELATSAGPMLVLTALGVAVGHMIQRRRGDR